MLEPLATKTFCSLSSQTICITGEQETEKWQETRNLANSIIITLSAFVKVTDFIRVRPHGRVELSGVTLQTSRCHSGANPSSLRSGARMAAVLRILMLYRNDEHQSNDSCRLRLGAS
jgi:hypothetical protein